MELLGRPPTDILLDWSSIVIYDDIPDLANYGRPRRNYDVDERKIPTLAGTTSSMTSKVQDNNIRTNGIIIKKLSGLLLKK